MSDDWKVGDLALCVDAGPFSHPRFRTTKPGRHILLSRGAVYRVARPLFEEMTGLCGLALEEFPDHEWLAERFRKIRPDEHEDCEPEFVTLLNNCKPVKVQA